MVKGKLDLVKEYKSYYSARLKPEVIEFDEAYYITISGRGEPGGGEFKAKVSALYTVAYTIKNLMKHSGRDFVVPKLEGFWWVESDKPYYEVPRNEWYWKLLIRMPEYITPAIVEEAKIKAAKKPSLVSAVKFERIHLGKCVQILHIGPYSTEPESIAEMHKLMEERGLKPRGYHHEIYLSDPRRTPPEKLKTILRQPVEE